MLWTGCWQVELLVAAVVVSRLDVDKFRSTHHCNDIHSTNHHVSPPSDKADSLGLFGLRGMGGVGKTTTAIAVAHSEKIRQAFGADNIWWITVGQEAAGMEVLVQFARKVWRRGVWVYV